MILSSSNIAIQAQPTENLISSHFLNKIFQDVQNSVVQITREVPGKSEVPKNENSSSLGSGFIYDDEGRIITNSHVVGDSKSVDITFVDGNRYVAKVIGKDNYSDIAVVQTDGNITEKLVPLKTWQFFVSISWRFSNSNRKSLRSFKFHDSRHSESNW